MRARGSCVVASSFPQRSVWFREAAGERLPPVTVRIFLEGVIRPAVLEVSIQDLVLRHEPLRTTFTTKRGLPVQRIHSHLDVPRQTVRKVSNAEELRSATQYRFDLRTEFPLRAYLYSPAANQHILLLIVHRIALDAWSLAPLVRDLAVSYRARSRGHIPRWRKLGLRYRDYAIVQQAYSRKRTERPRFATCLPNFRHAAQKGSAPAPVLPVSEQSVVKAGINPKTVLIRINAKLHKCLEEMAAQNSSKVSDVLHAGLVDLLAKSGTGTGADVLISTAFSGRTGKGMAGLVGAFSSAVPLRIDTSGDPTFRDLIQRVCRARTAAAANPRILFEDAAQVGREQARELVSSSMLLSLREGTELKFDVPGARVQAYPIAGNIGEADLVFDLIERRAPSGEPAGIEGQVQSAGTIQPDLGKLLDGLVGLLKAASGQTAGPLPSSEVGARTSVDRALPHLSPILEGPRGRSHWQQLYVPPGNPLHDLLCHLWERLLGVERVGIWDTFVELGGDNRSFIEMLDSVEGICGRRPPIELTAHLNVETLAAALVRELPPVPLQILREGNRMQKPPFFFLHGDWNGGGYYCRPLSLLLEDDQPFIVLQAHGLNGIPVRASLEVMAADHLRAIRAYSPAGPYCLGGHCNGGLLAFEIASRLVEQGESVSTVVLVNSEYIGNAADEHSSTPSALPPQNGRLTEHLLHAWTSSQYFHAIARYVPRYYFGKVVLLWPREESMSRGKDTGSAWRKVSRELEMRFVAGNHLTCLTRHAKALAAEMNRCLTTARVAHMESFLQ